MEELEKLVFGFKVSIQSDFKDPKLVEEFNNLVKEVNKKLDSLDKAEIVENLELLRRLVFKIRMARKVFVSENSEDKIEKLDERYLNLQKSIGVK